MYTERNKGFRCQVSGVSQEKKLRACKVNFATNYDYLSYFGKRSPPYQVRVGAVFNCD